MPTYQATKYLRRSYTDDKSTESESIANQRKLIDHYLEQHPDIEAVDEQIDDGYSGVLFDRPAFQKMMRDVADGKINCVIVKDLSRLGREYIETGRYLRRVFPAYGVRFIAINDNIDTARDDNSDDLHVSVKNIMNEAYCRDISVKTRSSLQVKRKNGDFVGAFTVYGYVKSEENHNKLEIDPYAASVVREIFRSRLEGMSALRMAAELNSRGILSPLAYKKNQGLPYAQKGFADRENCKWSATAILRILRDETYTGTLAQGKQTSPHFKIKEMEALPATDWIRVHDAHDAIVERHDFDLVQRIWHLDTRISPKEKHVYLFSGMLICGCCGSRMTRKVNRVSGKEYVYYYCIEGKRGKCEMPVMVKESDLIECALLSVKAQIDNVVSLERLLNGVDQQSINQSLVGEYTRHIKQLQRQIEEVNSFKAGLYERLVSGLLSKDDYMMLKKRYDDQGRQLKDSLAEVERKLNDVLENRSERMRWTQHFIKFSTLQTLDRKAAVHLIQYIKVHEKSKPGRRIEIRFNYQDEYQKAKALMDLHNQRKAG